MGEILVKEPKKIESIKDEKEFVWKVIDSEPTSLEKQWRMDIAVGEGELF